MSIDYAALAAELAGSHPITGAYSAVAQTAADELNAVNIEVNKNTTPQEAADATDGTEFNSVALSESQRQMWVSVLGWATINLNAGIGLETAIGMWNSGSTPITKAALLATRTKNVSQASQLKLGVNLVKHHHVAHARGEI